MELTLTQFLVICPLVGLAGFIDAVAGGGGLVSLPAYLIAGLPTHNAIATNKLSSAMGTTLATVRYARSGFVPWKLAVLCIPAALAGSSLGANLALLLNERVLKWVMLFVLPLTAAYLLRSRTFREDRPTRAPSATAVISTTAALAIGIYDGFYGPGTGTFLILLLTGLAHLPFDDANGLSKLINLSTNFAALAVYLINGRVLYPLGLAAGCFNILGSWLGTKYYIKGGAHAMRPVMLLVLILFFVKVLTELLD